MNSNVDTVVLTRVEKLRKELDKLAGFPPMTVAFYQSAENYLSEKLKEVFNEKIFPKREWEKEKMMVKFSENPKLNYYDDNYPNKEVEFLMYPKNRKKEGYLQGKVVFQGVKNSSNIVNTIVLLIKDLEVSDEVERNPSKKTSTGLSSAEASGWEKLHSQKLPLDVTNTVGPGYMHPKQVREKVLEHLAKDYFGTDGSEIRLVPGNSHPVYLSLPNNSGYQYVHTYEIFRCHHRKEMNAKINVIEEFVFGQTKPRRTYKITKVEKN